MRGGGRAAGTAPRADPKPHPSLPGAHASHVCVDASRADTHTMSGCVGIMRATLFTSGPSLRGLPGGSARSSTDRPGAGADSGGTRAAPASGGLRGEDVTRAAAGATSGMGRSTGAGGGGAMPWPRRSSCRCTWPFCADRKSQVAHLKGFSPVCTRSCCSMADLYAVTNGQYLQHLWPCTLVPAGAPPARPPFPGTGSSEVRPFLRRRAGASSLASSRSTAA